MKTSIKYIALSILVLAFANCRGIYEDSSEEASDLRKMVKTITVDELNALTEAGETYTLLDVRQANVYLTGNIPGSVSLPRGDLEFKIGDTEFWSEQYMYPPEKKDKIIVYCNDGNMGTMSAAALKQLGYENVYNLKGGFKAFNPNQDPKAQPKAAAGCGG